MVGVVPASWVSHHEVLVFYIFSDVRLLSVSVPKMRVSPHTQAAGHALAFLPRSLGWGDSDNTEALSCHFLCKIMAFHGSQWGLSEYFRYMV